MRLPQPVMGPLVSCSLLVHEYSVLIIADVSPPGPLNAFTITDGRVVTGANPASTHVAAEAAVAAFDKL